MKKKVLLLMACGALAIAMLAGCSTANNESGSGNADEPEQVTTKVKYGDARIKDDVLTFSLTENPTTGYTWSYVLEGTNLVFSNDSYVANEAEEDAVGTGGRHEFVFDGAGEGTATLTFTEGQQWEGGEVDKTMIVHVTTDAQNNIVSVDEERRPT